MISFSDRNEDSITLHLSDFDAIFFRKLAKALGSEKRAQNAIILQGYLTKLEQSCQVPEELERIESHWESLVGVSKEQFDYIVANIR
jgi:hypothetical protein